MNKVLLDTDIFSEITKQKNPNVIRRAEAYRTFWSQYTISTITIIEVLKGLYKANQEEKAERFLAKLSELEVLNIDLETCKLTAHIFSALEKTGQIIGRFDPLIASIAIKHNLPLATGNINHYKRIQDLGYSLLLENWKE